MIRLFRKQKVDKQSKRYLLHSVKTYGNTQLRKITDYLSNKAQQIPEQRLAWTLISACLIIAFALSCKLYYSWKHKSEIEVHSISAPAIRSSYLSPVDDVVLRRIKNFHHYMDSVKSANRPLYDSIMKVRPRLMDSIITIEEFTNQ